MTMLMMRMTGLEAIMTMTVRGRDDDVGDEDDDGENNGDKDNDDNDNDNDDNDNDNVMPVCQLVVYTHVVIKDRCVNVRGSICSYM